MRHTKILFLVSFLLILQLACSSPPQDQSTPETSTPASNISSPEGESGYPIASSNENGYPAPESEVNTQPERFIEEEVDIADLPPNSVTGIIAIDGGNGRQPVSNARLYLAEILVDSNGEETVASYSRTESIGTISDSAGRYLFTDVPSGRYGLVLDTVINAYILMIPNEPDAIIIEVSDSQATYVDDLVYDTLPLPGN